MNFMPGKKLYFVVAIAIVTHLSAQNPNHITGPLGVYHVSTGYTYRDTIGVDSLPLEQVLTFGEMAISDQGDDYGLEFEPDVDTCLQWNANRIFGIIQPPTERGIYNQVGDTVLLTPIPQIDSPGMIQGGARFSKLSQLYSGFSGVILDDWNHDTSITHKVHDALLGKTVDADGNVYSTCPVTTPYNKLYCVIYYTNADPAAMPYVDGLSFWYWAYQNCCYANLDGDINALRANWPGKEILIGIYISDSDLGWLTPVSVQYMLEHALDRYDDGDINGVIIFRGPVLTKDLMTITQWNSYALPFWLDSLYYPYLGQGDGRVYDCSTGSALSGAFVNVFCKGRVSGDTMMRSRQKTDVRGHYQFGLWAGNRNTDSTYYWLIAEKAGYITDTVGFWIKRNDTTALPAISLCAAPQAIAATNSSVDNMLIYPNPSTGFFTVEDAAGNSGDELEVYNLQGQRVYSTNYVCSCKPIDLSGQSSGAYLVLLKNGDTKITQKRMLVLEH
jgi:hypothetical protein